MSGLKKAEQGDDISIVLCGQAGQGVQTIEFLWSIVDLENTITAVLSKST